MAIKEPFSRNVFHGINYTLLFFLSLITVYPFLYVLGRSFAHEADVLSGKIMLFPTRLTLESYVHLFKNRALILSGYATSIFVTVTGTFLNIILTSLLAYGISRRDLPGRKLITFFVFFTMLFAGGMIPTYLVVRATGLLNSRWALIIPVAVAPWNTIILRNFYQALPESLPESARLDGCSEGAILFRIIMPLSMAALATVGLFYAVGHWNRWFNALVYLTDRGKYPLQLMLREILANAEILQEGSEYESEYTTTPPLSETVRAASIIVTVLPIILVYPFIQKYFVKGVVVGSIKG